MTSTNHTLPETCKAIWCEAPGKDPEVRTIPTPQPTPGSVVVKVIATETSKLMLSIINGTAPGMSAPFPYIPGARCVGRVAAVGPDTTNLAVGQLVIAGPLMTARDDPDTLILWGGTHFGGKSKALMDHWRYGAYAEYVQTPLELCWPVNEQRLCGPKSSGGLGYTHAELLFIVRHLVSYCGWKSIDLQAGETVLIAPSTGAYSGSAVEVASAMGARVIAASRNLEMLRKIQSHNARVEILQLTGDAATDAKAIHAVQGPIDVFMDICPPAVQNPTHMIPALQSLRPRGRASFLGFIQNKIEIPYALIVLRSLTIRGEMRYDVSHARNLLKLVETGLLKIGRDAGHEITGEFKLEQWEQGLTMDDGWGKMAVFTP